MRDFSKALKNAEKVLLNNTYELKLNNQTYRRTVPSREFYIHQWNWDSATHAMGFVHIDEELAFDEIRSLVSGQWENGLVAQITFNPKEKKYFPGSEFWGTEKFANGKIITSGITQPPLLGASVLYVYQNAQNRKRADKFADEILPSVIRYHDYLKKYRDQEDSGLLTIIHPWESGTDNSPRWDTPLDQIDLQEIPDETKKMVNKHRSDDKLGDMSHRPALEQYYKYMYLVNLYKEWGWDYSKIIQNTPFAVKDVLFTSLWALSNDSLSTLLELRGRKKEAQAYSDLASQTRKALAGVWRDEKKQFYEIDVSLGQNKPIYEDTIATFMPILAGATNESQLEKLLSKLKNEKEYATAFPVPSTSLSSPKFDLKRYWRGPTWPITNLFIIEGLNKYYPDHKEATKMRDAILDTTLSVIAESGFYEYYDPQFNKKEKTDTTWGFGSFSWTAAIFIYLYYKYNG